MGLHTYYEITAENKFAGKQYTNAWARRDEDGTRITAQEIWRHTSGKDEKMTGE
jgi:hypothetical protein